MFHHEKDLPEFMASDFLVGKCKYNGKYRNILIFKVCNVKQAQAHVLGATVKVNRWIDTPRQMPRE